MADSKREANLLDEVFTSKRSKVDTVDAENVERNKECLDTRVSETNKVNGVPEESAKEFSSEISGSSESTIPCKSEVSDNQVGRLSFVEADAAEDKGSRHSMEDAWVVLPDASLEYPGKLRCAHFAIYDGHGGRLAAEYAKAHLHANVLSAGLPRELMDIKTAKKSILEGFRRTDELLLQESVQGNWLDGATAVCVWILGQTVLVANIGDAKAVLARSSSPEGSQNPLDDRNHPLKAIVITREHKAIYPQERARIQKAGGSVGPNGRLQGRLEVSRAFGDRQFKKVGVIATPDVHSFELTEREHFMILGCDGLWGVFGPTDAVEFVRKQLKDKSSATTAARRLVREAVRERRLCREFRCDMLAPASAYCIPVCDSVHLSTGVVLEPGVILSFKVEVGPQFLVPAYSKVSLLPQPSKQDSDEELEYPDVNSGVIESPCKIFALMVCISGTGYYIWTTCETGLEEEWRHSIAPIPAEKLKAFLHNLPTDFDESSHDATPPPASGELHPDFDDRDDDDYRDSADFEKEVEATFRRALTGLDQDNVIIEINALRLSSNMSHADGAGALFYSIMKLAYNAPHSSQTDLLANTLKEIDKWKDLLKNYLKTKDEETLNRLYDNDTVTEDAILTWAEEKEGADESDKIFLKHAEPFIT